MTLASNRTRGDLRNESSDMKQALQPEHPAQDSRVYTQIGGLHIACASLRLAARHLTTDLILDTVLPTTFSAIMLTSAPSVSGSRTAKPWFGPGSLPQALKQGVGALHDGSFYFGLGSAGCAWWQVKASSRLAEARRMADFPGPLREQAIAAAVGPYIYVFGGAGIAKTGRATSALTDIYRYDVCNNTWSELPSGSPQALLGASALVNGDRVVFVGGVCKAIFDGFCAEQALAADEAQRQHLTQAYLSEDPAAYAFSPEVFAFKPTDNTWRELGRVPGAPVVGAALATTSNALVLLGGELKPGLRSRANWRAHLGDEALTWQAMPELPPGPSEALQEGLAGAFAGYSHGVLLLAGGTNFPGAQARFARGHRYAHQGMSKTWRDDIWAYVNGAWQWAGRLPQGRAHGLCLGDGEQLQLLGGEAAGGTALASCIALEWDGAKARVSHG